MLVSAGHAAAAASRRYEGGADVFVVAGSETPVGRGFLYVCVCGLTACAEEAGCESFLVTCAREVPRVGKSGATSFHSLCCSPTIKLETTALRAEALPSHQRVNT